MIELPLPWCLSSAESFARGAVGLLGALGAERLCFGSETGELAPLEELARLLLEPGSLQAEIRNALARTDAVLCRARRGPEAPALERRRRALSQPNNILAVEY